MAPGYAKDSVYYFADGNVTLLVAGTLFRVHKSIFARDGSMFEGMFDLDATMRSIANVGSASVFLEKEGSTDENPIHLHGDTADEFRGLLWSLYALPQEVATVVAEGDVTKLSNVVRMAHKYHYITTEAWALGALLGRFSSQSASSILTPALVQITEVAVLCDDKPLLDAVRLRWRSLIGKKKDLAIAINVMGRLGIRDLEGLAYYGMLFQGKACWNSDPGLTRDQRIRLLSGYHNFTKASEAIAHTPPDFIHHPLCSDKEHCKEDWGVFWNGIAGLDPRDEFASAVFAQIAVHDKMDLMGRLMMTVSLMTAICQATTRFPDTPFVWSVCIDVALQAAIGTSKELQDNLMSFFEDVP